MAGERHWDVFPLLLLYEADSRKEILETPLPSEGDIRGGASVCRKKTRKTKKKSHRRARRRENETNDLKRNKRGRAHSGGKNPFGKEGRKGKKREKKRPRHSAKIVARKRGQEWRHTTIVTSAFPLMKRRELPARWIKNNREEESSNWRRKLSSRGFPFGPPLQITQSSCKKERNKKKREVAK